MGSHIPQTLRDEEANRLQLARLDPKRLQVVVVIPVVVVIDPLCVFTRRLDV